MFNPYLGKDYTEREIEKALYEFNEKIIVEKYDNISRFAAQEISKGKIIGWFQGKSECGPRALGNRSILADPRDGKIIDIINKKVKFREFFRPFAPAVLWEYQKEYFEFEQASPYMLMVSPIREEVKKKIPAVVHIDGTGRLQTVMRNLNAQFYDLVNEFYKLTGIPLLLNTSFNIKGEPIVETPEDAIKSYLNSNLDSLFIGNYQINKRYNVS